MNRPRQELLVVQRPDGTELLACPTPGDVRWRARAGETLVAGSVAGVLSRGGRVFDLVLPGGVHGQIREVLSANPLVRCGHGSPLAVLGAVEAAPVGTPEETAEARGGAWEVRAPSHGTFYRRPSPNAPPYAEAGQEIDPGATIGLVEVMKCFSPITFEPPAGVGRGRVVEVLLDDGREVRADQVLARIELI